MQTTQLIKRNLSYYWHTNLAVVFGVATAVAVLAGALLVGDSVRASLRDLFLQRLGNTDHVITAQGFFRDQLASDIQNHQQFASGGFASACPLIALEATVTHEPSKRVGSGVRIYGVDERFWRFHSRPDAAPRGHQVLVSDSLARELGTRAGDSLVLRIEKPSEIPIESLHSRKEDLGSTLRLTVRETPAADALGEFSVQPQQSAVRAVFVPLDLLQKAIDQERKVNLILVSETSAAKTDQSSRPTEAQLLGKILEDQTSLEDFGITLRVLDSARGISLERDSKVISDTLGKTAREAASSLALRSVPVLSYLANSIGDDQRTIPYSIVTAVDADTFESLIKADEQKLVGRSSLAPNFPPPIILNEWAARDLGAVRGGDISVEYYYWHDDGRL